SRRNEHFSMTTATSMRDGDKAARLDVDQHVRLRSSRVQTLRPTSLTGGAMVRRAYRQRSLVEDLLPDADKLWDPALRRIDELLDDEILVDRFALSVRHPRSRGRGRLGTPAAVVLRILVLKHLRDWSFANPLAIDPANPRRWCGWHNSFLRMAKG